MNASNVETGSPQPAPPIAAIVDAVGIRSATSFDVQEETVAKRFFWLDIFGGGEVERTNFLNQLGLEADDVNWMQRFGQTSRMMLGRRKLRAVNWLLGRSGGLVELHLLSCERFIVTQGTGGKASLSRCR